jgi:DNA replication factor GINS
MDAEDSAHLALKDVFRLLKKEIEAPALQAIQLDTFQKIAASLGNLKGQGYEGIEAKVRDRMAELLAGGARLLIEARQAKIRAGEEPLDYSKLTDEEKYVLDGKRESEGRMSQVVAATIMGRPKVLESISARMRSKQIVVRFMKPTEAFVGVDMSKYGPFQQEDVASLPFENARAIIEGGAAVEVHVE